MLSNRFVNINKITKKFQQRNFNKKNKRFKRLH